MIFKSSCSLREKLFLYTYIELFASTYRSVIIAWQAAEVMIRHRRLTVVLVAPYSKERSAMMQIHFQYSIQSTWYETVIEFRTKIYFLFFGKKENCRKNYFPFSILTKQQFDDNIYLERINIYHKWWTFLNEFSILNFYLFIFVLTDSEPY